MFTLTVHSLFFTLAILVAVTVLVSRRQQFGGGLEDTLTACVWIVALGFLSARLGYLIAYPEPYQQIWDLFTYYQGGLVSFGGILGGLMTAYWQRYRFPHKLRHDWLSSVVIAGLWAWVVGRWGNYLQGESGGVPVSWLGGIPVPIQIVESTGCLILALWLTKSAFKPLKTIYFGLIGYLILRFIVDFWRSESIYSGLRVSQWVVMILSILIVAIYVRTLGKTSQADSE